MDPIAEIYNFELHRRESETQQYQGGDSESEEEEHNKSISPMLVRHRKNMKGRKTHTVSFANAAISSSEDDKS